MINQSISLYGDTQFIYNAAVLLTTGVWFFTSLPCDTVTYLTTFTFDNIWHTI